MDMPMGSPAWLTLPIQLHSSREFDCGDFTPEQCAYYQHRWHFWYIADLVFALPTVAFFMCVVGVFIIGHAASQMFGYRSRRVGMMLSKSMALTRYLSYRGFRIEKLRWNSAPLGALLLAAVGIIYFFCMDLVPQPYYWPSLEWGGSPPLATRSGWMALACMPFVFATASKANWITLLTGISHEKLQVFHRWIAYAFFLLALLHTFPFIVYHIRFHDMEEQVNESSVLFYWTGIVALVFQAWLTFASHATIRKLGYEFFKISHFAAVIVFVLVFFWHCDYILTSWDYFIATAAVYVPCLVFPWLRTCFEYGWGQKAKVSVEENDFIRIDMPVKFDWIPGQHCFLRFTGFGMHALTTHPFTICSLPSETVGQQSEATFFIRKHSGFTSRLHDFGLKRAGAATTVTIDGPYGGIDMRRFYASEQLVIIAGGSGAGWIFSFVEEFARHQAVKKDTQSSTGPMSMRVILATRHASTQTWFLRTLRELLSKYDGAAISSCIQVDVYLTKSTDSPALSLSKEQSPSTTSNSSSSDISSIPQPTHTTASSATLPTATKEMTSQTTAVSVPSLEHTGRPDLANVIRHEVDSATAASSSASVGFFVCGPTSMQHDARNAVATENLRIVKGLKCGGVYLHMEHFSWA